MVQIYGLLKGVVPGISSDHHVPQDNTWLANLLKHMTSKFDFFTCSIQTGKFDKDSDILDMGIALNNMLMYYLPLRERFGLDAHFKLGYIVRKSMWRRN